MKNFIEELPKPILIEDLGMKFPTENSKERKRFGRYQCGFCGAEFITQTQDIKSYRIVSCGCYRKEQSRKALTKHNLTGSRLYRIWGAIKTRTSNTKDNFYSDYGGRGITICDEWKNDFMSFYNWAISNGYSDELSIDRIDNDGNYCPENCKWSTQIMQSRNQRIKRSNTSGYKGCSFDKMLQKYRTYIRVDGKQIYVGLYLTPEDGAVAYNNYIIANDLEGFPLNKLPDSHLHLQLPTKPHNQTLG